VRGTAPGRRRDDSSAYSEMHRRNTVGLKPWRKGQTGNPSGRPPKAVCIPDILGRIGNEALPEELRGKLPEHIKDSPNMLTALMRVTYLRALQGESWAVQFVSERTEGKVKDVVAVERADPAIEEARRLLEDGAAP